ncbi:MAG TPA: ATP synthase F1 subunit epsilon, partial [Chitinophagaceae bacterium]|nr:ATP synthase F1 subunit epsilon [Chitinophagaceae bacterium]
MQVDILTPEGKVFSGEADSIMLPGLTGKFQVLKNHAPLIAALTTGTVVIKTNNQAQEFKIRSGICEVLSNHVSVLTE